MRWVALRCVLCRFVSLRCVALFSVASFVRSCWGAFEAVCLSFLAWCGALGTLLVSLSNTTNFDLGSFYANFMEAFGAMPTTFQSTNQIKNTARFRKHLKKAKKVVFNVGATIGWCWMIFRGFSNKGWHAFRISFFIYSYKGRTLHHCTEILRKAVPNRSWKQYPPNENSNAILEHC